MAPSIVMQPSHGISLNHALFDSFMTPKPSWSKQFLESFPRGGARGVTGRSLLERKLRHYANEDDPTCPSPSPSPPRAALPSRKFDFMAEWATRALLSDTSVRSAVPARTAKQFGPATKAQSDYDDADNYEDEGGAWSRSGVGRR